MSRRAAVASGARRESSPIRHRSFNRILLQYISHLIDSDLSQTVSVLAVAELFVCLPVASVTVCFMYLCTVLFVDLSQCRCDF